MIEALAFLVDTLFSLLFWAFLLRCLLQWVRAGFRNPLGAAVLQATDWLVLPLRRVLPSLRGIDTASVLAVLAVALAQVGVFALLTGSGFPDGGAWLLEAGRKVLRSALWLYFWAIFVYALLSMVAPGQDSPLLDILEALCEPVLARIRRAVPAFAGLDLSPMWAAIIIQVLLILTR